MKRVITNKILLTGIVVCVILFGCITYAIGLAEENSTVTNNVYGNVDSLKDINDFEIDSLNDKEIQGKAISIIKEKYKEKAEGIVTNYNMLIEKFNIPTQYNKVLDSLIIKGYDPTDIFIAYEFLHENYGKINEVEVILIQRVNGKSWIDIMNDYKELNGEFVPSRFPAEYLNLLLQEEKIIDDDITIADRLSNLTVYDSVYGNYQNLDVMWQVTQPSNFVTVMDEVYENDGFIINNLNTKTVLETVYEEESFTVSDAVYGKNYTTLDIDIELIETLKKIEKIDRFETLIEMKKEGLTWAQIKTKLGVLNLEENIKRLTIDINKLYKYLNPNYYKEANINENINLEDRLIVPKKLTQVEIIEAIVMSEKLGVNEEPIVRMLIEGQSKEHIYLYHLQEIYKK